MPTLPRCLLLLLTVAFVGAIPPAARAQADPLNLNLPGNLPGAAAGADARATVSAEIDRPTAPPGGEAVVAVVLDVAPGFHAQSHTPLDDFLIPLTVTLAPGPATLAGEPVYPPPTLETYPLLGKVSVYTGRTVVYVRLKVKPETAGAVAVAGTIGYQICDDKNCFAPEQKPFSVNLAVAPGAAAAPTRDGVFAGYQAPPPGGPDAAGPSTKPAATKTTAAKPAAVVDVGSGVKIDSTLGAFGIAFVAGLIFNVMPCVLPVLPLKVMGFYEVSQHDRSRCAMLGGVFSLGLVSVFAILGVLVLGLKVISWGGLFSKWWFVWPMVALLVGFAAAMFGAFNFQLPAGVYRFSPRHDTVFGNFALGAFTAVLATPCTAPLLPPLLVWAATQAAVVAVFSMVMVGVGMAVPYLLLSFFPEAAKNLPRAGAWPDLFKQMMGFLLLVAAAYFAAGRVVPGAGFLWIPVAVLAVAAVYLMARTVQLADGAAAVAVSSVLAVALLGGGVAWAANQNGLLARPAAGASGGAVEHFVPFTQSGFDKARANGPVLVKFTANWCLSCQYIEGTVYQSPAVWSALADKNVTAFKVDLTGDNPDGQRLLLSLNPGGGIPLTAVYQPDGPTRVLSSVYTASDLLAVVDQLDAKAAVASR